MKTLSVFRIPLSQAHYGQDLTSYMTHLRTGYMAPLLAMPACFGFQAAFFRSCHEKQPPGHSFQLRTTINIPSRTNKYHTTTTPTTTAHGNILAVSLPLRFMIGLHELQDYRLSLV